MELLTAIDSRRSAAKLTLPGPTEAQLQRILAAAARAPDHGRLTPWEFKVLGGDLRERVAAAAAEAKRLRNTALTDEQVEADRKKFLRSPCTVVACAVLRDNSKIPGIEQVVATAAAVQNLFLAAHDMGFGVMWKTGAAAYDAGVKGLLGLRPEDHIIGIMHLGTRVE